MGPRQHTRPEGHPSPPPPFWEAFGCVLYYATRAEMVPGRREDTALLYRLDNPKAAAPLFAGWEETMLWSCLSGVMGEIYAAAPEAPSSAAAAGAGPYRQGSTAMASAKQAHRIFFIPDLLVYGCFCWICRTRATISSVLRRSPSTKDCTRYWISMVLKYPAWEEPSPPAL